MSGADLDVEEEADEADDEPAVEIKEEPEPDTREEGQAETRTIHPFYSVRGEPNGSVKARAGWRYNNGDIHSMPIDNTVAAQQAQQAGDIARNWYLNQLNRLAQQQQAEEESQQRQQQDGRRSMAEGTSES